MTQPLTDDLVFYLALAAGIEPDPDYTVTEWADNYRMLPKVSSSEPGKYRSTRTPYLIEIMDVLSVNSPIQDICFMKSTQIGATEAGINWILYIVDYAPGPTMLIMPTETLVREVSKQKIGPSIKELGRIDSKIRDARIRDSGNTIMAKEFPGGILFLCGSNSPAGYRSKTIRNLFIDDADGFNADIGEEGDPVSLISKRTDTFSSRKKIYLVSTPTIKGLSRIEQAFNESDQRYYFVPCPHCGEMQRLVWGGRDTKWGVRFKVDKFGYIESVWYECRKCHEKIEERYKTGMLAGGEWRPTFPERIKRGYHLSAIYSPLGWVSWKVIAGEFLEAKNHKGRLKVWNNTRMGLPFEEKGSQPAWAIIMARCEPYEIMTVPDKGLLLTSGVDTQDNRLIVSVYAWGKGEESWLVYHGELYGDPAQADVWAQLDIILERSYHHVSGADLRIESMAIDTGGHRTQSVYNYCRAKMPRVIAIQGASKPGRPVISNTPSLQDVDYAGVKIEAGVQLWTVGTDTAKAMIYGRLNLSTPGPGFMHFPIGIGDEFFQQLTAEKIITEFRKGFPHSVWVKTRERNDGLDTCVYAYAAAIRAGISYLEWDEIEKMIRTKGEIPGPRPDDDKQGGFLGKGAGFLGSHKNFLG